MREWKLERARRRGGYMLPSGAAYLPEYPGCQVPVTAVRARIETRGGVVGKRSKADSEYRLVLTVFGYRQRGGHVYMVQAWRKKRVTKVHGSSCERQRGEGEKKVRGK